MLFTSFSGSLVSRISGAVQVARASQADGEAVKAFMEGLQLRIGRPVVTDKVYDPSQDKADPDAKEQLMQIFGRG
ncbi:hypothetical protein K5M95_003722 [Escherichia coli]|nr:hypothetical protein [Escherichia coli]